MNDIEMKKAPVGATALHVRDKDTNFCNKNNNDSEFNSQLDNYWIKQGYTHYNNGEIIPINGEIKANEYVSDAVPVETDTIVLDLKQCIQDVNLDNHCGNGREDNKKNSMFLVRTANQCLEDSKNNPPPRNLYKGLIYENEVTILYANKGVGKSILSVQIANEIAKVHNMSVLYFDLELSDKQFENRYSNNYKDHFVFDSNFYRATYSPDFSLSDDIDYDTAFFDFLKLEAEAKCAKVVIVDNMSMLVSSDTDSARNALPLMRKMVELKRKEGLTLLLLEHTRKTDDNMPIHSNQMQGSKHKSNLIDHEFSIGESTQDRQIRYIKETKASRTGGELLYDQDNVMVCELAKENSFVGFYEKGFDKERRHIKLMSDVSIDEQEQNILDLRKQGKIIEEIAAELKLSKSKVGRIVNGIKKGDKK